MIPKVIHYCWFSGNEKNELIKKCIESWKKFAPDFEIKEWNEINFNIDTYIYAKEAYQTQKWAFVSDVARFHILYENGGIYLDTDVELLKPIDYLLENKMFMSFSQNGELNSGLIMGSVKEHPWFRDILDFYKCNHFFLKNGLPNTTTVCTIVSRILEGKGIALDGKDYSDDNIRLYSAGYFDPYNFEQNKLEIKENTISIHHYAASWKSNNDLIIYNIGMKIKRIVGKKLYLKIAELKHKIMG